MRPPTARTTGRFAALAAERDREREREREGSGSGSDNNKLTPPVAANRRWDEAGVGTAARELRPPVAPTGNSRLAGLGRDRPDDNGAPIELQPPTAPKNSRWEEAGVGQQARDRDGSSSAPSRELRPPSAPSNSRWNEEGAGSGGGGGRDIVLQPPQPREGGRFSSLAEDDTRTGDRPLEPYVRTSRAPGASSSSSSGEKPSFARDGPRGGAARSSAPTDMFGRPIKAKAKEVEVVAAVPTVVAFDVDEDEEEEQQDEAEAANKADEPPLAPLAAGRLVTRIPVTDEEEEMLAAMDAETRAKALKTVKTFTSEFAQLFERNLAEAAENVDYYMQKMPTRALWREVPVEVLKLVADNEDPSRERQTEFARGAGALMMLLREQFVDSMVLTTAFEEIGEMVPDIALDNPNAPACFSIVLQHALAVGALVSSQVRLPAVRKLGGLEPLTAAEKQARVLVGLDAEGDAADADSDEVNGAELLRTVLELELARVGSAQGLLVPGEDAGTFETVFLKEGPIQAALGGALLEADAAIQLAALVEVQRFAERTGFVVPKVVEATMMSLYDNEVLPEAAFLAWRDDAAEDGLTAQVPGKDRCLAEVREWLDWLEADDEESSGEEEEESSSGEEESSDEDDDDDDDDDDSDSDE